MKRIFLLSLLLGSFALGRLALAEQINSFLTEVQINQDGSAAITETITYDFGDVERHGMYRNIPYDYQGPSGQSYSVVLSDFTVVDETGQAYNFTSEKSQGQWVLKIGDADVYVSGQKIYQISYQAQDVVTAYDDHDEFYWDSVGTDWTVPILQTKTIVSLPQNVDQATLQYTCYYGPYGSTTTCASSIDNQGNFVFSHESVLSPGDSLTVVAGWPKGLITGPSVWQRLWRLIGLYGPLVLALLIIWSLWLKWRQTGRDPEGQGTIITQFGPPGKTTPSEVGTIIDERVDQQDLSAEIINLAILGYLKINRLVEDSVLSKITKIFNSADYELSKLKEAGPELTKLQQQFFQDLFAKGSSVKISELKKDFYPKIKKLQDILYQAVVEQGYFVKNPQKVRRHYLLVGIAILVLANFIVSLVWQMIFSSVFSFLPALLGFGLIGLAFIGFSFLMPQRTKEGVLAKEHILGLKSYLTVAEKDRLKFHNAPAKNPEHFEKLLPYAMVLKVEKEWAQQFADLYKYQPQWYSDPSMSGFNTVLFVNSLSSFAATANSLVVPPGQHSGGMSGGSGFSGGFSGGGVGGGGGGSW